MAIILGVNYVIHQFLLISGDTHGAQRVKKNPKVFTRIIVVCSSHLHDFAKVSILTLNYKNEQHCGVNFVPHSYNTTQCELFNTAERV